MRCQSCGADNPAGMKFCGNCATPLKSRCPQCGFENPPAFKFCGECAAPLGVSAERTADKSGAAAPSQSMRAQDPAVRLAPEQPAAAVIEGERKTVTALFVDIKGSMDLMEDLDPEEARRLVDPALQIMMDAVHRYDGYIVQSTGDGVFALFGAPAAHEDHPQRGIFAALRMQEEMRKYSARLREAGNAPIEIRVGLNTGEVVVRSIRTDEAHTEYTPIGHSTSLAARMQTLAATGSIVVTEHTQKLVQGYFELRALGPARVKGVSDPVNVYEVTGLGPLRTRLQRSAARGLSKFVGRRAEMEQLGHALELSRAGHGQIVAAMADAGVGKSRLFHEFKLKSAAGCLVLEGFSVSHGRATAYLPVIDLLKNYFRIDDRDDERLRREKITGKVLALDRALEDTMPYLFAMLGVSGSDAALEEMDAAIRRRRTREALKRLVLRESLDQPLILIFEDLHWIDDETQALLNLMVESIGTARILMMVNYRPEYRHEWGSKSHYTQLRLDPLGMENADELVAGLLDSSPSGDGAADDDLIALKRIIIARTEGNPFFMEEMVQVLFDEGVLVRNGKVAIARPIESIQIPATVKGILAARIDRLGSAEKELLQTLAVIGKEFPLGLVRSVARKPDDQLQAMLEKLQIGEFLYEQPAFPEPEYTFKHALTQEVAYDSVLMERRKQIHERAAVALEELYAAKLDDHLSELAHHYGRSGNAAGAIKYLRLAGEQASQRSAYVDTFRFLNEALRLLATTPESAERDRQELRIQVTLGPLLTAARGFAAPEVEANLQRTLALSRRLGESPDLFAVLMGVWALNFSRGRLDDGFDVAKTLVKLAPSLNDLAKAAAGAAMGANLLWTGAFRPAREHLARTASIYDGNLDFYLPSMQAPVVASRCQFSFALWMLGYPDQALKRVEEARRYAEKLRRPHSTAFALQNAIAIASFRREHRAIVKDAQTLVEIAREHGFPYWTASATMTLGRALITRPETRNEGREKLRQGIEDLAVTGAGLLSQFSFCLLAEGCLEAGEIDEGLAAVAQSLAGIETAGQRMHESEVYRLRGELLLQRPGNEAAAEQSFRQAIEIAHRQEAKSYELRGATSLTRLLAARGDRDEARAILAPVYGWFTEGFDTADLKDAKALLDTLA
jgi:class 3 adenylate cyclase/tetratricopeptide (TPR) repeat protein